MNSCYSWSSVCNVIYSELNSCIKGSSRSISSSSHFIGHSNSSKEGLHSPFGELSEFYVIVVEDCSKLFSLRHLFLPKSVFVRVYSVKFKSLKRSIFSTDFSSFYLKFIRLSENISIKFLVTLSCISWFREGPKVSSWKSNTYWQF